MLTPQRALEIVNNENRPDNSKILKRWTDVYFNVSLHTKGARPAFKNLATGAQITPPFFFGSDYQYLFDNLLFSRHPREEETTRNWRYSQYRPFTQAPLLQLIEIVMGAIFQDSQYTITIKDTDDQAYIYGNNFAGPDGISYDLINYFVQILGVSIFEDPNGYIIRMPAKPRQQITETKVPVSIQFVRSVDVVYPSDGEDFIFQSVDQKYMYWVNQVAIFRYVRGENGTGKFQLEDEGGYFAHGLGYLPISKAGGSWNTEGFFNSYLYKAIPIADEFIASYSAEQMVDKESSHPFIQMAAIDCPSCDGQGQINTKAGPCEQCPGGYEWELTTCPTCRGKKTISFNPADRISAPVADMDKDMVKIVAPPVEINQYHREKNSELMKMFLEALGLYRTDKAESGEAKSIDQERLYQFIATVNNNFFDNLIFGTIRDICAYRNVTGRNGIIVPAPREFSITKPSQFQIKTAADLLDEIGAVTTAKAPAMVRTQTVLEFIDKRFGGDENLQRKTRFIAGMDKAFVYSPDEKGIMVNSGELSRDDLFFSINLPQVMDQIEREKGAAYFGAATYDQVKAEVDRIMSTIPKPEPPAPAIPAGGNNAGGNPAE